MIKYRVLLRHMPNRKWQVWAAMTQPSIPGVSRGGPSDAVAVVKHAGKPTFDRARLKLKGSSPKLPFNTLPTYEFDTREDALGIAMQLGYALKLGPMMYAWLDEEKG